MACLLIAGFLFIFTAATTRGASEKSDPTFTEAERMMQDYFTGPVEVARSTLQKVTHFVEDEKTAMQPLPRAAYLSIQFARLFDLERRFGTKTDADIAYRKACYWTIRRYELSAEAIGKKLTPEKAREMLDTTVTPEFIAKIVLGLNRSYRSGGAVFMEGIKD